MALITKGPFHVNPALGYKCHALGAVDAQLRRCEADHPGGLIFDDISNLRANSREYIICA